MIKNRIAITTLILACSNSVATPDAAVSWDVVGLSYNGLTGRSVTLDLEIGISAVAAHGYVSYTNNQFVPVTGSCFFTGNFSSLFCSIAIDQVTVRADIDLETLNGTAIIIDEHGDIADTGSLLFSGID